MGLETMLTLLGIAYGIFILILPLVLRYAFRRIRRLEHRLQELEQAHGAETPSPAAALTASQPVAEPDAEPRPATERTEPPAEHPVASAAAAHPESPPGRKEESSWTDGWPSNAVVSRLKSWLLGGHTLARIGVLILFFGVAFLLKYAAERGLLPIELRLAAAALGGLVLIATGWRLRGRRRTYGLILQGGGIGIVYLTVFAAVSVYRLLPELPGQILLVILIGLATALAVLQDARGLALLATIGGFLAPVLISSDGSHVLLFGYYAALDAGILAIAWFKAWRELNLAGFVFTFAVGSLWGYQYYRPELYASTQPFLLLYFGFYVAVPILYALRQRPDLRGYVDGTLVFGVPLVAAGIQATLVGDFEYGLAVSAFGAGAFYVLLALGLWRWRPDPLRLLVEAFLALGVAFLTLAIPFAVDGRWTGAAWALEGAALIWIGIRQRRLLARASGAAIQAVAGVALLTEFQVGTDETAVFNGLFLGGLLIAASGLVSAYHLLGSRETSISGRQQLDVSLLTAWGLAWGFGTGLHEIWAHAPIEPRWHFSLLFVAIGILTCAVAERRLSWPQLRYPPLGLTLFMAVAALETFADSSTHPLRSWGLVAWPFALAVHYWALQRYEQAWTRALSVYWGHAAGLWLVVFLSSWELAWHTRQALSAASAWHSVAWALVPAMTLAGIVLWGDRCAWPLRLNRKTYLETALRPVAAYLAAWTLYTVVQRGDPAPLPYLPVLNPIELMQLIALASVSIWSLYTRLPFKRKIHVYLLSVLGFAVLNGAVARGTHFLAEVPYRLEALYRAEQFQTATSITWTILALGLTLTATRKGLRELWFAGTGLLGLVVLKLFLVDLAGVGTIARIVSFIVVGALILVVAYWSPLPPGEQAEQDE